MARAMLPQEPQVSEHQFELIPRARTRMVPPPHLPLYFLKLELADPSISETPSERFRKGLPATVCCSPSPPTLSVAPRHRHAEILSPKLSSELAAGCVGCEGCEGCDGKGGDVELGFLCAAAQGSGIRGG